MRSPLLRLALTLPLALLSPRVVQADHAFVDDYQNDPCCDLDPNTGVRREVILLGLAPFFRRNVLENFSDDPLLPVSNGLDLELLWDNEALGDGVSLALTAEEDGTYLEMALTIETDVAYYTVDPAGGLPQGGVVVRYTPSPQRFYAAYGLVSPGAGGLEIRFHLEKWGDGSFEPLDIGPGPSDPFPTEFGENFHIALTVSEPGASGFSQLTATFERIRVVDGVATREPLLERTGIDDDLRQGYIGCYAAGGTLLTQVAFDKGMAAVEGTTQSTRATWGEVKSLYR